MATNAFGTDYYNRTKNKAQQNRVYIFWDTLNNEYDPIPP